MFSSVGLCDHPLAMTDLWKTETLSPRSSLSCTQGEDLINGGVPTAEEVQAVSNDPQSLRSLITRIDSEGGQEKLIKFFEVYFSNVRSLR